MAEYPEPFIQLMIEVVQALSGASDSADDLSSLLGRIASSFSFGNAFIYESDHTKTFILREHSAVAPHIVLPDTFRLENFLSPKVVSMLGENPIYHDNPDVPKTPLIQAFCDLFAAQSLYLVFIKDPSDMPVACVGMTDKRLHFALSPAWFAMANSLLKLVAERARFRIYRQRLNYTTQTLEDIMGHSGFDIHVIDYETHELLYANQSMAAPYGGLESIRGRTCYEALYDYQTQPCDFCPRERLIDENGNPGPAYTWEHQRSADNTWQRVISSAFRWVDGRMAHVVSSTDVTQAKNNELYIHRIAFYDTLTGIPNRRKLEQDFNALNDEHHTDKEGVSLLFMDLNRFKEVNDTYGHRIGDLLLLNIAQRVQKHQQTGENFYRFGGDEFIYLLTGLSPQEAETRAKALERLFDEPFHCEGCDIQCGCCIGAAHYPHDGNELRQLIDHADSRMYRAKQQLTSAES